MAPVAAAAQGVGSLAGSWQVHAPHMRQPLVPSSRLQLPAALQHSCRQISQAHSRVPAAAARPIAFASVEAPVPTHPKVRAFGGGKLQLKIVSTADDKWSIRLDFE